MSGVASLPLPSAYLPLFPSPIFIGVVWCDGLASPKNQGRHLTEGS